MNLTARHCRWDTSLRFFPAEEKDLAVPSVQHHLRRCHRVWNKTRAALLRSGARTKAAADCHRIPAPTYLPGQMVWLSSKTIPLKTHSRKLSPRFLGPFKIATIINPSAVRLQLPPSLRIHPTFHVSQIKPVRTSELLRTHLERISVITATCC
ncbi:hypothetical protein NQD34_018213 [Periophthalmus magnuspinnatus]|nr:hypothetical protein NQD34_018213 [Periophthalmus magnuspinnatus]